MPTVNDKQTTRPAEPAGPRDPAPDRGEVERRARELAAVAERLEDRDPREVLRWAVERYRPKVALACSFGMQSVAMIDMLWRMGLLGDVEVFYLDTGVLFAETHQTRLRIQDRYGFRAVRVAPELSWEDQRRRYGGHLYERGVEGINTCCYIRKVEPMQKHFAQRGFEAWITGLRRGHSRTRADVPLVLWDRVNGLVKVNPVAAADDAALWDYIRTHDVPYNPLYDQGYPSIGCNTPVCTRPVRAGEEARAGRWDGRKTECGIHLDGQAIRSLDSSKL